MNHIELTKICKLCRLVNDDVSCEEAIELNRCQVKIIEDDKNEDSTNNEGGI